MDEVEPKPIFFNRALTEKEVHRLYEMELYYKFKDKDFKTEEEAKEYALQTNGYVVYRVIHDSFRR